MLTKSETIFDGKLTIGVPEADADLYFSVADIVKKCTEKIVELTIKEKQTEKEVETS